MNNRSENNLLAALPWPWRVQDSTPPPRRSNADALPSRGTAAATDELRLGEVHPLAVGAIQGRYAVLEVGVDAPSQQWLDAVGLRRGEVVTVLRRAAFGGPMHVRTGSGAEFALGRGLAECITVGPEEGLTDVAAE